MTRQTKSRLRLPLVTLVVALVAALTLGSFGAATASGLTKSAVKKIATKVVKKQAGSLTVASAATATTATTATTAGNSTLLAGQPASAYQDTASVYLAAITTATDSVRYRIPLAAGNYQISYSAYLNGAGTGDSECYLDTYVGTTAIRFYADDGDYSDTVNPAHSGTGVVPLGAGQSVELFCDADNPFTTYASGGEDEPIQIVVTPLDSVVTALITASARGTAARH